MDHQYFFILLPAKATLIFMRILELFLFFQQTIMKMNTSKSPSRMNDFENEQIKITMINAYF